MERGPAPEHRRPAPPSPPPPPNETIVGPPRRRWLIFGRRANYVICKNCQTPEVREVVYCSGCGRRICPKCGSTKVCPLQFESNNWQCDLCREKWRTPDFEMFVVKGAFTEEELRLARGV